MKDPFSFVCAQKSIHSSLFQTLHAKVSMQACVLVLIPEPSLDDDEVQLFHMT